MRNKQKFTQAMESQSLCQKFLMMFVDYCVVLCNFAFLLKKSKKCGLIALPMYIGMVTCPSAGREHLTLPIVIGTSGPNERNNN